ncbi:MAG: TolC family protein [Saprospiraceae bacterium]|nr:TolC family protein [Saprospiraceae bacterium]
MRNFLALLLVLSCSFATLQAQESWSLQKCVDHARQNSLNVKQAQYGILQSELANKQARMNRLPNLSASIRGGYQFGRTIDPTTNEFKNESIGFNGFGVDAGVTLFNGLVTTNTIKQSKFDVQAAKLDAAATSNDIALQVASSYLSILLAEEQLENAKVRLQLSEAQLEQTDKLIQAGSLPVNDRLDFVAQIAREQQSIIEAENLVNINYLTLKQLLELDPNVDLKIDRPEVVIPAANPEAYSLNEIYTTALGTQPQIEAGEMRMRSAEVGERIAYGQSFPTLSLFAGMSSNYSSLAKDFLSYSEQIEQNFGQYAQVNLNIPIYSNHRNRVGLDRARLATLNQDVANKQAKNLLKTNVQRAIADALAAKESYAAAQRSEEAADAAYINAQRRFDLGAINSLEFTTASNNLNQAKVTLIQAKYQYLFNLKVVDFYMGKTLEIN